MTWRPLLALPLAALLIGDPVRPPRLLPALEPYCPRARTLYLLAYAYREENPGRARAFGLLAEPQSRACPELGGRIRKLLEETAP